MTILHIAQLTIRETQRRRLLWVGALMGVAFLVIFGLGFHFIYSDLVKNVPSEGIELPLTFLTISGLYATNLLVVMVSILVSVATISGEIESHTIDSLITKPIRRCSVILGKWLGFAAIILVYTLLLSGGVMLLVYLQAGWTVQRVPAGLAIIYLSGLVGLSISLAGGSRLSTLANGALAFMLFGVGFIGGWVEQIGALLQNETAVDLGIVASLLMPTEALWRIAAALFEPRVTSGLQIAGPFLSSPPSKLMLVHGIVFALALLGFAVWSFSRRDL